jgi:hypothetical protein
MLSFIILMPRLISTSIACGKVYTYLTSRGVVKDKTTILGTVHTIFNDDGTVRYLAQWLTDIFSQKAAEGVLRGENG